MLSSSAKKVESLFVEKIPSQFSIASPEFKLKKIVKKDYIRTSTSIKKRRPSTSNVARKNLGNLRNA